MANLLDKTTQTWVKATGRSIDPVESEWLLGPIGEEDIIADSYINNLIAIEGLERTEDLKDYGLLENFHDLGLTEDELIRLHPKVRDFYEHTFNYHIDFWSEWRGIFKPFGLLLSILFSKRLQQLNLPMNLKDSSQGLESHIIKLKKEGHTKYTIWYRKLRSTDNVIYSGIYTTCKANENKKPFLKVIFPLPNGNGTVFMDKRIEADGALTLSSEGTIFGESGFYFTLTDHNGKYWAKRVRSMHEWIKVYVDDQGIIRADHKMNLWGMRFMNLHYRMQLKNI